MPTSTLREAQESDIAALAALINEAYAPAEGFLYDGPRITAEEVRGRLARGHFLLDVGSDGTICGCVYVAITGDAGYFGLLSVSPERQGRGLGRILVGEAESYCRSRGCRTMTIDVVNHRQRLFAFYASLGYVVAGERPFEDARLNRPAHFVILRKALAAGEEARAPG